MLELVRRPRELTMEFEYTHVQLTRQWWTPRLPYEQASFFRRFDLHISAVSAATKTAVLTGLAAACIHGVPILNKGRRVIVDLTLPGSDGPPPKTQHPEIVRYRYAKLSASDIAKVRGYRVTTIERTFVDICALHEEVEALAFLEAALRRGYHRDLFQSYLNQRKIQWGIAKAQRVLDQALYGIDSVHETHARYLLAAAFPTCTIVPQAEITSGNAYNYRVDLLLDDYLIIEIDGRIKYTEAFTSRNNTTVAKVLWDQIHRQRCLQDHGYHVLRFFPDELEEMLVAQVAKILAQNHDRTSPREHWTSDLRRVPRWLRRCG